MRASFAPHEPVKAAGVLSDNSRELPEVGIAGGPDAMASAEKKIEQLLELALLADRGARTDAVARALRTAIALLDADAAVAVVASSRGDGDRQILYAGSDTPASFPSKPEASEALRILGEERQALSVADLSDQPAFAAADACPGVEAGPVLFAPVDQRAGLPAYVAVYRKRGRARYTQNETELMLLLAGWLGASLECLRLTAGAERLALTDEVTQVYNARFLKTALRREVSRADRHNLELTLVMIEVDGLEAFREAHGKAPANRLLQDMAAVLARQVRSIDLVGRHGDGFMAILPQTGREDACEVAERMRAAVAAHSILELEPGAVTATFGIAGFPQEGRDADALLAVADRALAEGHGRGGNCVGTPARKAA